MKTNLKLRRLSEKQKEINDHPARFKVVVLGRRSGKTTYLVWRIIHEMLNGKTVGFWVPSYVFLHSIWRELEHLIPPEIITVNHKTNKYFELITGGSVSFHSVSNNPDAGRGQKYHLAMIDEASLIPNLKSIWNETIRATLVDYQGQAIFTGTPKSKNDFYQLYLMENSHPDSWKSFKSSTLCNPYLPPEELEIIKNMPKTPYNQQEYFAEFLESGGQVFGTLKYCTDAEPGYHVRIGIDLAKSQDWTVITVFNSENQMVEMVRFKSMDWDSIIEKLRATIDKYTSSEITIDNTGVGSPIADRLEAFGYDISRFNITEPSRLRLLENLALMIDNGEVEFLDEEIITKEFEAFSRVINKGKVKLLSTISDDIVFSCGLALYQDPFEMVIA